MQPLLECVPNFSEGRDMSIIRRITGEIESVDGATLLDVDPGRATHRTVVTFVGLPAAVVEAAFRAGTKAAELIDMRKHRGEHPRFGAMDVCPLVPVGGITMEETVEHARALARRLGEAGLTVYCYEHAAFSEQRRNLADVRSGEYEGLADKLSRPDWKPDFGPAEFNPKSGATAVGARDFLIAYNINLNTTSTRRANAVAFDVRERGRVRRRGDPLTGEIVRDDDGNPVYQPGSLKSVKAIGWFIEEYGIAQVSMNLTDIAVTPIHIAFEEARKRARERGLRVTGSELVGMVPLRALLDAGKYFLRQQGRSLGVPDREIVKIAVRSLGLDDLAPFAPEEKVIEYKLAAMKATSRLVDRALVDFANATASEAPAPGGGSVAAAVGALGAALGTMVANLSSHKRGWDDRWEEFSDWAERGKACQEELLRLVDADTEAFEALMAAFRLPQRTDAESSFRQRSVREATCRAIEVPLAVMETALESMAVILAMAESGLASSVSDAGVGALCARAAVLGGDLNVRINCRDLEDRQVARGYLERAAGLCRRATEIEGQVREAVERRL